jgi:5-methylcytosine-specific restriction endonuclease McrA
LVSVLATSFWDVLAWIVLAILGLLALAAIFDAGMWLFAPEERRRIRASVEAARRTAGTETGPAQRPSRIAIPERVRHEVWRRDQGRCVECGSRERLEFDHIIPLSRGGSNTARNVELRCEKHNRSKGARI